jgi:hypothetical protein
MTIWTTEAIRAFGPTSDLPTLVAMLNAPGYDAGAPE